jgi:hypothetical protein
MGPLGGSGGPTAPLESSAIQVALNAPAAAGPASGYVAASLVTLTQMLPSGSAGQEGRIEPVETIDPSVVGASGPLLPPAEELAVAVDEPSGAARGESPDADPVPLAPVQAVMIRVEPPTASFPAGPIRTEDGLAPRVDSPAVAIRPAPTTIGGDKSRLVTGAWLARWVVAVATVAAVARARTVIRNLEWRKRTAAGGARPAGPFALRAPHAATRIALRTGGSPAAQAVGRRSGRAS